MESGCPTHLLFKSGGDPVKFWLALFNFQTPSTSNSEYTNTNTLLLLSIFQGPHPPMFFFPHRKHFQHCDSVDTPLVWLPAGFHLLILCHNCFLQVWDKTKMSTPANLNIEVSQVDYLQFVLLTTAASVTHIWRDCPLSNLRNVTVISCPAICMHVIHWSQYKM